MTIEVSRNSLVVAVKDLVGVVRLISHGIDLAEGHMADWRWNRVSWPNRVVMEKVRRLTNPSSLAGLLGVVQFVAQPGEDAVRVPERLVLVIKPDCDIGERVSVSPVL